MEKFEIYEWSPYDQSAKSMVRNENGLWKSNSQHPIINCGDYATICGKIVLVRKKFELKEI